MTTTCNSVVLNANGCLMNNYNNYRPNYIIIRITFEFFANNKMPYSLTLFEK